MRFFLDEDLSGTIAEIARGFGLDVVSTQELHRLGRDDASQLAFAASEGRCLVTRDRDHFIELTLNFALHERPHLGVLIVPYTLPSDNFRMIARALAEYDRSHSDGLSPYTVDFLRRPATF